MDCHLDMTVNWGTISLIYSRSVRTRMACSTGCRSSVISICIGVGGVALDLVDAPASQTYVERLFSVCGDLTARKRNKTKRSVKDRVVLKLHCAVVNYAILSVLIILSTGICVSYPKKIKIIKITITKLNKLKLELLSSQKKLKLQLEKYLELQKHWYTDAAIYHSVAR